MYQITAFSQAVQPLFFSREQGVVHSVYDKTVNLIFGQTLLSLQAAGTVSSPLTLATLCTPEELRELGFRPGMPVRLLHYGLFVEGFHFDTLHAGCWDPYITHFLPAAPSIDLEFLLACLRGILPRGGFSGAILPAENDSPLSPCAAEAKDILSRVRPALSSQDWPLAAQQLSALVGLGEGLTPSGDDFLCGLIAACHLVNTPASISLERALCSILPSRLDQTNTISAAFLRCAMSGQFSQPVIALAQGASLSEVQTAFASIGHSSGADTLCGMIFLFSTLEQIRA